MERGQIVGFLGPNGAGKTTTMRVLTCFLPPTSGTASVAGFDVLEHPMEVKNRIGYLPETRRFIRKWRSPNTSNFVGSSRASSRRHLARRVDEVAERCASATCATS